MEKKKKRFYKIGIFFSTKKKKKKYLYLYIN